MSMAAMPSSGSPWRDAPQSKGIVCELAHGYPSQHLCGHGWFLSRSPSLTSLSFQAHCFGAVPISHRARTVGMSARSALHPCRLALGIRHGREV